jgi:hypothetical protein
MSELTRRSEVLETYAHPYRRYVGQVVLGYGVPRVVAFAALFVLAGAIAELVTDRGDDILAFGIAAVALAAAYAVWTSARAVQMVREPADREHDPVLGVRLMRKPSRLIRRTIRCSASG